jgi:hypothetical protein
MDAIQAGPGQSGFAAKLAAMGGTTLKIVGGVLALYVLGMAIFAFTQYSGTRSTLLSYGLNGSTASLIAWVVMLVALGIPALAIVRVFLFKPKPLDYVAVTILPLISWGMAQLPAKFDAQTGKALQFCAARPDGTLFCLDHAGVDPITQRPLVAVTGQQAENDYRRSKGLIPQRINAPLGDVMLFDPLTGEPKAWVARNDKGCYDVFNNPGAHPQTGDRLMPINKDIVARIKQCAAAPVSVAPFKPQVEEARAQAQPAMSDAAMKKPESPRPEAFAKKSEFAAHDVRLKVANNTCRGKDYYINGTKVGTIPANEARVFNVAAGPATVLICTEGTRRCASPTRVELPAGYVSRAINALKACADGDI